MAETEEETYQVEARDGREVSAFIDYVDSDGHVEFNCPSCKHSILPHELVQEGGATCPGCERTVRLHITSHDLYGEWRNVPEEQREVHR